MIYVAGIAGPGIQMRIKMHNHNRGQILQSKNGGIGDAMVATDQNGKSFFCANLFNSPGNVLIGQRGYCRSDFHVAAIRPTLPFQDIRVAIEIIKTIFKVGLLVILRCLANVTRAVAFTWPSPSAFIEWRAQDGDIRLQMFASRDVRRTDKRAHSGKGLQTGVWRLRTSEPSKKQGGSDRNG